MEKIFYSLKQVELMVETTKVLIPLCTGFIIIAAKTILWTKEKNIQIQSIERLIMIIVFVFSILSVSLWCCVFALMIDCANVFTRYKDSLSSISVDQLNWEWSVGQLCAQSALLSLSISIILYSIFTYKLYMRVKS